jgi:GH24 family phage-related lysozyme (muramidase)
MLVQPTTIAQAQAAGSPYFWDNGKKKLAVTAEQLAAFKGGAQYDPAGGSALTQWANIHTQPQVPQMDLEPVLDIPRQEPTLPLRRRSPVGDDYYQWRGFNRGEAPPEPSMMDRVRGFVGGILPGGRTESGIGGDVAPRRLERPVREGRVAPVSYSQVAMDKIADWEGGYQDKPFDDVGTRRIGFGRKAKEGEETTEAKERGWLMGKVQDIGDWLDSVVTADLNANQKAALTSLVYNVGQGSFKKSKALKALNAGDMDEFKRQAFSKEQGWVKSKGKFVKGLHNRRQKEQALFFG